MAGKAWQIASGAWGRNYADTFLDYDVMLMGPGDPGPFDESIYGDLVASKAQTRERIGSLAAFCRTAQDGDYVLLRQAHRVVALGVIANNDYRHCNAFDDVSGWDIQHTRRVIWQDHLCAEIDRIQQAGALFEDRKQIPTFTRVNDPKVLNRVSHLFPKVKRRSLLKLPPDPEPELSLEAFGEALFTKGLSNDAVDKVLSAFRRQRRLTQWYADKKSAGRVPSEHEVIAHLVLPMLLALGWSEQLLAVEWQKIDLAAFCDAPTKADTCVLVCEAKAPGAGLAEDLKQPTGYIKKHGLSRCQRILLTEGTRFYLYSKDDSGEWKPTGYFNTGKLRLKHVIHSGTNPIDSILDLGPARLVRG
jgi:hypothetical protein